MPKDDCQKLRRCPFCGGEATIYEDRHENIIYGYNVACDNCCATIFADTEEEAIEAWNKRVPQTWTSKAFERIGEANKTIENVVTCGECKYFERLSPDSINGYCTSEEVASDDEGGACFSCSRGEDDYCSFGWKGKEKL